MVRGIREESANARVGVFVDVDCRAQPELIPQHASVWFSEVSESLAPGLTAQLRASAPPAGVTPTDWERPFGEPGQMIGIVTTMRWSRGRVTGSSRWCTRSAEASLGSALGSGSFRTSLVVDVLDELGRPSHTDENVDGTSRSFAASAEVNDEAPGWLRLAASASAASLCADEHAQTAWTEVLATVMDRLPVTFGYVGLVGTHDRTLWEAATMGTQMYTWENTEHSHDWLRGLGWLTVVPPTLAGDLAVGSPEVVAHTSPAGAVLLQATTRLEDFDHDSALLLRRCVELVLLPGELQLDRLAYNLGRSQTGVDARWALGLEP